MAMDVTDHKILELLKENSRAQWRDIGAQVHMTGPAVAARVRKLEDEGVIEAFTVRVNPAKIGRPVTAFVTVYMETPDHHRFQTMVRSNPAVIEFHRTSGGGCYLLKVQVEDNDMLKTLLDAVLKFGNYGVSLSIEAIK